MGKFDYLNVPDQWNQYFTKYPQGYTILEALLNWVQQVDDMVDNQNDLNTTWEEWAATNNKTIADFIAQFDTHLQTTVTDTLTDWQNSGFLTTIINNALKTKLDDVNTSLQTQITALASGSPKGVYTTVTDLTNARPTGSTNIYLVTADGGWYYWNNTAWVKGGTYQGTMIAVGAVNESKTSFFTSGKNLFDKYTISNGYYADWVAGGLIANSGYNASEYIPVTAATNYIANYGLRSVVFYDTNKVFLSAIQNTVAGVGFTTPANTGFIRVTALVADNNTATLQVEKGNHITNYEAHYLFNGAFPKNTVDGQAVKDGSLGEGQTSFFKVSSKNLLNVNTLRSNTYLNPTTGNFPLPSDGNQYTYYVTDYIAVNPSTAYICNKNIRSISYFDSSKNFVSGVTTQTNGGTSFTTPTGIAFMRCNLFSTDDMTAVQLEQGTVQTTFESHFLFSGFIPQKFITSDKLADGVLGNLQSKWLGKTYAMLGDSITWQDGNAYNNASYSANTGQIAKGYGTLLKTKTGLGTLINYGISGASMARSSSYPTNGSISVDGQTRNFAAVDLVTIAAGTNDFKLNVALGTQGVIGDTTFDDTTFYGSYRKLIEYMLTQKPNLKIVLFTPLQRNNSSYDVNTVNSAGAKLNDYRNAIINIGAMYGIPVLDLYGQSGITKLTFSTYLMDGLHPQDTGYARMSELINPFLENH
jgi:lysophospholipase L1-like esterase